jgi:hypothetical protein
VTAIEIEANGDFLAGTRAGKVVEISKSEATELCDIGFGVAALKVSHGGALTFCACDASRTRLSFHGSAPRRFDGPIVDFAVCNEDVYIAHDADVQYLLCDAEAATWTAATAVRSVAVDANSMAVACCTGDGCFVLDSRAPTLIGIGLSGATDIHRFLPAPFMDIALVTHGRGFSVIDLRRPEVLFATCRFDPDNAPLVGEWLPNSRLFATAWPGKFAVCSPYLRAPIVEMYEIALEPVRGVQPNLGLSLVLQERSLTVFGGFGEAFAVPAVL